MWLHDASIAWFTSYLADLSREGKWLSEQLPFFILVRHEELIHLPTLELQLVLVVLGDGDVVADRIILGGEELLERHHRRLGEAVGDWRCVVMFTRAGRWSAAIRAQSSIGIVVAAISAIHSIITVHAEPAHRMTAILEVRPHSLHRRRRVSRRTVIIVARAISKNKQDNCSLSVLIVWSVVTTCLVRAIVRVHLHQSLFRARLGTCRVAYGRIRHQSRPWLSAANKRLRLQLLIETGFSCRHQDGKSRK